MYTDIITYELAEGMSLESLKGVAQKVVDKWMINQKGFLSWEINSNSDGSYTDLVIWESQEDAKNAEKNMANFPLMGEWFACYKQGSISSKNLISIVKFDKT